MMIKPHPIPAAPPAVPLIPPRGVGASATCQGRDFAREALIRLQASRQQTDL